MIRVVLVDDQELVRAGLRRIFRPRQGIEVVAECADGGEVLGVIDATEPDVVVMDVRMPGVDGITATAAIRGRASTPPVLVLTTYDDDGVLSGALRAGASGFALKDAPGEELIAAVRSVAEGNGWLDPDVTARVLAAYRTAPDAARSAPTEALRRLTEREVDVLRLVGRGATNQEIATELFISETTVKSHIGHIFTKLDLRDRAAAIVFAFDNGVVVPGG